MRLGPTALTVALAGTVLAGLTDARSSIGDREVRIAGTAAAQVRAGPKPQPIASTGSHAGTRPPGTPQAESHNFTDGKVVAGRYDSTGTASVYTWNLKGSG
jgi:hypothetical protein